MILGVMIERDSKSTLVRDQADYKSPCMMSINTFGLRKKRQV